MQPLQETVPWLPRIKGGVAAWPSSSVSEHVPRRTDCEDLDRYLYTCVHRSTAHGSPNMMVTSMPPGGRVDEPNGVTARSEMRFGLEKEGDPGTVTGG